MPGESVDFLVYNDHAVLRALSDRTGAMIDVSGERDTPKRLSDRIVTISGLADQKEAACRGIVERLRRLQDLQDAQEIGYFVIIVPASAVPVIVGAKGATIKDVLETSGVELSIGKENVMGMPDTPIGLEGTAAQVVAAVANIHRVVQDMADRGRLMPSDFKYRPDRAAAALANGAGLGLPQVSLPPREHDPYSGLDPTQNFRTKAKLIVSTQVAGWLIGRQGRNIREMQENSGAFLHVLRDDEVEGVPPGLQLGDRIVEICGRYERKLEGLAVVMRTADNMPGNQAPKETLMLVPKILTHVSAVQEVAAFTESTIDVQEHQGFDEAIVVMTGSVSSRIQAAQAFLTRIDQAHMEGVWVAYAPDGEVVGKDGRPRKELREDPGATLEENLPALKQRAVQQSSALDLPVLRPRREQPQADPELQASRTHDTGALRREPSLPASRAEAALQSAPAYDSGSAVRVREPSVPPARAREPSLPPSQRQPDIDEPAPTPAKVMLVEQPSTQTAVGDQPSTQHKVADCKPTQPCDVSDDGASHFNPLNQVANRLVTHQGLASHQHEHVQEQPTDFHQDAQEQPSSFLEEPPPCPEPQSDAFELQLDLARTTHASLQDSPESQIQERRSQLSSAFPPDLGSLPGRGMFPLATSMWPNLLAILMGSTMFAQAPSQLDIVLPEVALQRSLVPDGYLNEVAQRCQVRIDLGAQESPASRQVRLTGTIVTNAMAVFCLQEALAQCGEALPGWAERAP